MNSHIGDANKMVAAAQEAVAWRDDVGNLYPSMESVDKYLPRGRTVHALYAAPVAAAPVDPSRLGAAMTAFDAAGGTAIRYAPEWMRKALEAASTPAPPGIDLDSMVAVAVHAWGEHQANCRFTTLEGSLRKVCEALIDASLKGGNIPAPRIELTNGQIAQLADFAGTPDAGTPLDEQDVLVIQHAEAGHSGPGLYAHYDELPEQGAIYLDGQLADSPKGGSDAERGRWLIDCAPAGYLDDLMRIACPATRRAEIDARMQTTSAEVGE